MRPPHGQGELVEAGDVLGARDDEPALSIALQERVETVRVYVTGPRSDVELLQKSGFAATADLTALTAGSHEIAPVFPAETYPDVVFTPEFGEVTVVLTEAENAG